MEEKGAITHLDYLLAKEIIEKFKWVPNETPASSRKFLITTVLSYVSFTFFLRRLFPRPIPPVSLKPIAAVYNCLVLALSFIMAFGCLVSVLSDAPDFHWVICIPPHTTASGPIFFWAYVFNMSKILEFADTLLIILVNSNHRLTFLHVFHHAAAVVMSYIFLETSQSLFPIVLVTDASVHVRMYGYYLSCSVGVRPKWKKFVTGCQIAQFYGSFVVLSLMLYYHFSGSGCSGVWAWSFNVIFYASLLVLFVDFHKKNYRKSI